MGIHWQTVTFRAPVLASRLSLNTLSPSPDPILPSEASTVLPSTSAPMGRSMEMSILGPGVTVTGGSVTGQTLSGMTGTYTLPTYPTNSGTTAGVDLGSSLPATLPRVADTTPAADGNYYYYVHGATIGATTITAGKKVVIVGDTNTSMASGLQIGVTGSQPQSARRLSIWMVLSAYQATIPSIATVGQGR